LSKKVQSNVTPAPAQTGTRVQHFFTVAVASCTVTQQRDGVQAECIFPFTHGGVTYRACISAGRTDPWCPTRLNVDTGEGDNMFPDADGFWGLCGKECPIDPHDGNNLSLLFYDGIFIVKKSCLRE
jgi:hypothetical protein